MNINFYPQLKKNLQGELRENFDLSKSNWLGIGGVAKFFFKPKDIEDLQIFLRNNNQHFPIIVIGSGSNLLIRDKGFNGIAIKFGKDFDYIKVNNEIINCGPSTQKSLLSEHAANNNLTGFEFLYCIPGTVAGGVVMNSGCYGADMSKIVTSISVIDMNGEIKIINNKDINFAYRNSSITKNQIITNVEMKGVRLDKKEVLENMKNLRNKKDTEQPQKIKTGGSTFKNPKDSNKKAFLFESLGFLNVLPPVFIFWGCSVSFLFRRFFIFSNTSFLSKRTPFISTLVMIWFFVIELLR